MRSTICLVLFAVSCLLWAEETAAIHTGVQYEWGVVRTTDDRLSPVLTSQGLTPVSAESLTSLGWRLEVGMGFWTAEVASARVSNTNLGSPTGTTRTRLVIDQSSLGVGARWEPWHWLYGSATVGVELDKLLLQTYRGDLTTGQAVWATPGQGSFQSDSSWGGEGTIRIGWRFLPVSQTNYGYVLGLGVAGGSRLGDLTWKAAGDVPVSGLEAPWRLWSRPFVFLGFE